MMTMMVMISPVVQVAPVVPEQFRHRVTSADSPAAAGRPRALSSASVGHVDADQSQTGADQPPPTYSPTISGDDTQRRRHVTHRLLPVCLRPPAAAAYAAPSSVTNDPRLYFAESTENCTKNKKHVS